MWPRVLIPRWSKTPGLNSTLNCDPESWFNVELSPCIRITIQCGILTQGHNSTWNSDPSTYVLPVELQLKKVSKFNSVIKIQQLRRVIIQRKIHWILTPGRYSIGGVKILSYTGSYVTATVPLNIWMSKIFLMFIVVENSGSVNIITVKFVSVILKMCITYTSMTVIIFHYHCHSNVQKERILFSCYLVLTIKNRYHCIVDDSDIFYIT